jgi:hypothetical protein
MTFRLIETALLLGAYVLLAGAYGLSYCLVRLWPRRVTHLASSALYAVHLALAVGIVIWAPLAVPWKALLLASSAAVLAIPPLTWRLLDRTHHSERGTT